MSLWVSWANWSDCILSIQRLRFARMHCKVHARVIKRGGKPTSQGVIIICSLQEIGRDWKTPWLCVYCSRGWNEVYPEEAATEWRVSKGTHRNKSFLPLSNSNKQRLQFVSGFRWCWTMAAEPQRLTWPRRKRLLIFPKVNLCTKTWSDELKKMTEEIPGQRSSTNNEAQLGIGRLWSVKDALNAWNQYYLREHIF